MEEDQPTRGLPKVLDAGDGLLAAEQLFLEVYRGVDPAQLVRDGAVVGLEAEAGAVLLDTEGLVGEDPDRGAGLLGVRLQLGAREAEITAVRRSSANGERPPGPPRSNRPEATMAKSAVRSATSTR
ncbi:hypothetical protein SALBM311S_01828 [Streptomyces alboniger]